MSPRRVVSETMAVALRLEFGQQPASSGVGASVIKAYNLP